MKADLINKLSFYSHLVNTPHTDRRRLTDDLFIFSQFQKLTLKNSLNSRDIDDLFIFSQDIKDDTRRQPIKAIVKTIFKSRADLFIIGTALKEMNIKPTDEQAQRQQDLKEELRTAHDTIKPFIERHRTRINAVLSVYSRINHIRHDIKNIENLPIIRRFKPIDYEHDTATYNHTPKQARIKDISLLQILKVLREKHRNGDRNGISTGEYKDTIKRVKDGKHPRHAVMMKIQLYNGTTRTGTAKHTIKRLKAQEQAHETPLYQITINGQAYKIRLKKHALYMDLYDDTIKKAIETEIKTRFKNSNKLLFINQADDGNDDGTATNTDTARQ